MIFCASCASLQFWFASVRSARLPLALLDPQISGELSIVGSDLEAPGVSPRPAGSWSVSACYQENQSGEDDQGW
jgi:hypothetical protein